MQRKNAANEKGQVKVRGVVAPSEWDMRDEVVAVTIYAQDDAEYIVNNRAMVRRLMKFMDEEVEAHGVLTEDDYGNDVLVVSEFVPIEVDAGEAEEEEEDEELEAGEAEDEDWEEDDEDVGDEEESEDEDWEEGGEMGGRRKRRRSR